MIKIPKENIINKCTGCTSVQTIKSLFILDDCYCKLYAYPALRWRKGKCVSHKERSN
ncbi:hypothetical protein KAR91_60340 [Candidatus Pacearchaeota archaeon]|nr:hypothetical protein [Candidatus Pacearchaeota archaeon]